MIRVALLCIMLLSVCIQMPARRTSQTVRNEKVRTARQITETTRKISANAAQTERQLAQLQSVKADISRQSQSLEELQKEQQVIEARIAAIEDTLAALDQKIVSLRSSYAKVLRSIRRQRAVSAGSAAIFASESALQATRRMRYLKQLSEWEQKQARQLREVIDEAAQRRDRLAQTKLQLDKNEEEQRDRLDKLTQKQEKANGLIASLRKQGNTLQEVLKKQKAQAEQLEKELQRIIEEEAQRETKKPGETTAPTLGTDFAQAKGKLRIPLDKESDIVAGFGRRTHEDFEKVTVQNNGVDFEAPADANAVAVFPGTVSMVIVMQGYGNVVLLRHGEYLTVYAGLADVAVRKGDKVNAGDRLGTVTASPADNARSRLHFEVRHEKEKLNPEEWLRK